MKQDPGKDLGQYPPRMVRKSDLPRPPLISPASKPTSKQVETTAATILTFTSASLAETAPTIAFEGTTSAPLPSSAPSLPNMMKKFGQIKHKLQSSPTSHEFPLFQKARHIFKDWVSLKVLHYAEKALGKLHQARLLTQIQHKSFLSFFENLRALREQHQEAERSTNRVKCYQEKHVKSTNVLQHLVEEGSGMEARIAVVDYEIQRLEEHLSSLKAEKVAFTNHLSQKVKEMEQASQEVEGSKSQLVNSSTYLGKPDRIFTIMQAYFFKVTALAEDVKLLD